MKHAGQRLFAAGNQRQLDKSAKIVLDHQKRRLEAARELERQQNEVAHPVEAPDIQAVKAETTTADAANNTNSNTTAETTKPSSGIYSFFSSLASCLPKWPFAAATPEPTNQPKP